METLSDALEAVATTVLHSRNVHALDSNTSTHAQARASSACILNIAIPLEFERIEHAKQHVVSSKCGHAAFCIWRESASGFVHGGLSGSSSPAWACGSRGGQLDEQERGEAGDLTVYTLLVLLLLLMMRPAIEWKGEQGRSVLIHS